ncbi:hypothetical protein DPMN_172859 [Dreissena polymorpha]|uniref:Uncharacterized protein n=1 Tax=Dreissena polymorpha TaxID=45954 RepID=A0A9D4E1L4_DREPO|nr:hypothetical protein DPMN_172849 [Dreissena polymorpha]KAH3771536.1 hypothetical protein DPMN_172859 [Dreissena polymorpha]
MLPHWGSHQVKFDPRVIPLATLRITYHSLLVRAQSVHVSDSYISTVHVSGLLLIVACTTLTDCDPSHPRNPRRPKSSQVTLVDPSRPKSTQVNPSQLKTTHLTLSTQVDPSQPKSFMAYKTGL